jgi:hypothetical protein
LGGGFYPALIFFGENFMITVSWQPGALRGFTVQQTSQMIIEGLQRWQAVCGVRFGTVPHGARANIRIYPYSGNMNGAFMGTYIETGQVIYTTNVQASRDFCVMAFAHEVGHCFGLGHVNRPEALMFTRGSSVMYFDHIEGRASWQRFGKFTGFHWPYSLQFLGNRIRTLKAEWQKLDSEWKSLQRQRDAERNATRRQQLNTQVLNKLNERNRKHSELSTVNNSWLRIKSQWESIRGINTPQHRMQMQAIETPTDINVFNNKGICECFKRENITQPNSLIKDIDMSSVYRNLPNLQVPINGL